MSDSKNRSLSSIISKSFDEFVSFVLFTPVIALFVTIIFRSLDLDEFAKPQNITLISLVLAMVLFGPRLFKKTVAQNFVRFVDLLIPITIVLMALRNIPKYQNAESFAAITKYGSTENLHLMRFLAYPHFFDIPGLQLANQSIASLFLGIGFHTSNGAGGAANSLFFLEGFVTVLIVISTSAITARALSGHKFHIRVLPITVSSTVAITTSITIMKIGSFNILLALFFAVLLTNEILGLWTNRDLSYSKVFALSLLTLSTFFLISGIWLITVVLALTTLIMMVTDKKRERAGGIQWLSNTGITAVLALGLVSIALVILIFADVLKKWFEGPQLSSSVNLTYLVAILVAPLVIHLVFHGPDNQPTSNQGIQFKIGLAWTGIVTTLVVSSYYIATYQPQHNVQALVLIGSMIIATLSVGSLPQTHDFRIQKTAGNFLRAGLMVIFIVFSFTNRVHQIDDPSSVTILPWQRTVFDILKTEPDRNVVCLNTALSDQEKSAEAIACSQLAYVLSLRQIPDLEQWIRIQKCQVLLSDGPQPLTVAELQRLTVIVLDKKSLNSRTGCSTPDWALPENLIPAGKWNLVQFIDESGQVLKHNQNLLVTN